MADINVKKRLKIQFINIILAVLKIYIDHKSQNVQWIKLYLPVYNEIWADVINRYQCKKC